MMITQEELKKLVHYDSETGLMTWKVSGDNVGEAYKRASGKSYLMVTILSRTYYVHRLIWLYVYGEWPDEVDHIDGAGTHNMLSNLRDVSSKDNKKNKRKYKNNNTGVCGVRWQVKDKLYIATIGGNKGSIYLGCFGNLFDAVAARKSAELKYGYHPNHGQVRAL